MEKKPMLTGDNRPKTIRFEDIDLKKYHFEVANCKMSENKPVIECELYVRDYNISYYNSELTRRLYKCHYEISALPVLSYPKYEPRFMEIIVRDYLHKNGLRMV